MLDALMQWFRRLFGKQKERRKSQTSASQGGSPPLLKKGDRVQVHDIDRTYRDHPHDPDFSFRIREGDELVVHADQLMAWDNIAFDCPSSPAGFLMIEPCFVRHVVPRPTLDYKSHGSFIPPPHRDDPLDITNPLNPLSPMSPIYNSFDSEPCRHDPPAPSSQNDWAGGCGETTDVSPASPSDWSGSDGGASWE